VRLFLLLLGVAAAAVADEGAEMGRRVQALLRTHQSEVFGCVTADVEGEVLLRVFVGDDGKPGRVEVLKDQTGNPALGKCLVAAVRGWDLSSLKADPGDQLVFPLAFHPNQNGDAKPKAAIDKVAACGDEEQAFYVLKAGRFNKKPVHAGDVVWAPAHAACRFDKAEVLRVRWLGPPAAGDAAVIAPPKPYVIKGGSVRIYLEGKSFALDVLSLDAGAAVPPHQHEGSDELIYVLSGKSTATLGGEKQYTKAGEELRMPAGVEHSVTVDDKLTAVQVYAPAGPEQRFKK
jgi:quercetin dioxygenase-like cupin family protein